MPLEQLCRNKETNCFTGSLPVSSFDDSPPKNTYCENPPILDLLEKSQLLHSVLVSLQCAYNPHDDCFSIDDNRDTFRLIQFVSGVADLLYIHCPYSPETPDTMFETTWRLKSILGLLLAAFCSGTGEFRVTDTDMIPLIRMAAELSDRLIQQFDVQ